MDATETRKRIDALEWYHDFDFGNGLKAVAKDADASGHRRLWKFMEDNLAQVDFAGKSVLDIGCWDGYWSFYAEKRGAASVLATDDQSQNWMGSQGFHLAKELMQSKVESDLNTSVYKLDRLGRKFDVVLFLGVYYHLFDPFYAFSQIRHCCHENTVVVVDGPISIGLPEGTGLFRFAHHACEFLPTLDAIRQIARGAYFTETGHAIFIDPDDHRERSIREYDETLAALARKAEAPSRVGWRWRLGACLEMLGGDHARIKQKIEKIMDLKPPPPPVPLPLPIESHRRLFMTCVPFSGTNELHAYNPPFGLSAYDSRFK